MRQFVCASAALALTLLLCCGTATSRAPAADASEPEIALAAALEVFPDPHDQFDASNVLAEDFSTPPMRFRRQPPNLGYPKHRHWLRLRLTNRSDRELERLLVLWRGSAHQLHLYARTDNGPLRDLGSGVDQVSRHAVTKLRLGPQANTTIAIRVDSASALALDLRLLDEATLARIDRNDYLWFGLLVGVVLAIGIYVFAIFLALRDRLYLLFVVFALCNVLYQLLSEGYLYAWLPLAWRLAGNAAANLSGGVFVICILLFVSDFLGLAEVSPRSYRRLLRPLIGAMLIAFPLFLWRPWLGNTLIALGTIIATGLIPFLSWRAMGTQRLALSFHLAALLFFASGSVHLMKRMGFIPDVPALALVLQIGSALIVIAFSIAVLDRVRRIAEENREVQRRHAEQLEHDVAERTVDLERAKRAAEDALAAKTAAQRQLVEVEKMASLGQLVAGVAHEVNTPIGVAVTAGSHLSESTQRFAEVIERGAMKRSDLDAFVATARESTSIIGRNLERAAHLIRSFKQVSVDRTSDGRRVFVLDRFLQELTDSLVMLWKDRPITLDVQCARDLAMDSFPGALGQVLTNLIQNALLHAFEPGQPGRITIVVRAATAASFAIDFSDDGRGVSETELARLFEPFYTTKRNQGGTGLGLHVAYNLVSHKLGGQISVSSEPGRGLRVSMLLPRVAPVSGA